MSGVSCSAGYGHTQCLKITEGELGRVNFLAMFRLLPQPSSLGLWESGQQWEPADSQGTGIAALVMRELYNKKDGQGLLGSIRKFMGDLVVERPN